MFEKAARMAPQSADVKVYLALHYARTPDWQRAVPLLEQVAAESPNRMPVLEALAAVRERQDRVPEALALRQRIYSLRTPTPAELVQLGQLAMDAGNTPVALDAFERARTAQGTRVPERPRTGFAVPRRAPVRGRPGRARSRAGVAPGVPDGALQAGPGERAAEGAGRGRADRSGPAGRRRDDARPRSRASGCSRNRKGPAARAAGPSLRPTRAVRPA